MNVLLVAKGYSGQGGAETVINIMTRSLQERGVNIFALIAAKNNNLGSKSKVDWLNVKSFKWVVFYFKSRVLKKIYYGFFILRYIQKNNINIVVAADEDCVDFSEFAKFFLKDKFVLVSWPHIAIDSIGKNIKLLKKAEYHLAISTGISNQLQSLGVDREHIDVVFNPIVISNVNILPYNKRNIVFIGRFKERHKQISHILSAVSLIRDNDFHLHLIGDGPDRETYEEYVKSQGLMRKVTFHGYQENAWDYLEKNIDGVGALVLSSKKEGLPMVLLEAMARGVFCISSDCETGPRDIIHPGINGELFEVGDINKLSSMLKKAINNEKGYDAIAIRESIRSFDVESYTDELIRIFHSLKG